MKRKGKTFADFRRAHVSIGRGIWFYMSNSGKTLHFYANGISADQRISVRALMNELKARDAVTGRKP